VPTAPRPPLSRPPDFEAFWAEARAELAAVDAAPEHDLIARKDEIVLERLRFSSLGGARLEGYLLRWETAAMRPLVVHTHGYGSVVSPEWAWARQGLNVAGVDIRGFGRSRAALPVPSPWGWALTGIGSPDTHVLRGAVCDLVQAAHVVRARLGGRPRRTVLEGMSLGGALALMAAAVEPIADLLVAGYPSLGWAEGAASWRAPARQPRSIVTWRDCRSTRRRTSCSYCATSTR
jgi:cephalosporin-C deacetylase